MTSGRGDYSLRWSGRLLFALILITQGAALLPPPATETLRRKVTHHVAPSVTDQEADFALDTALFGMGCFWAPQAAFQQVPGVVSARVGYANAERPPDVLRGSPSYFSVCQGDGNTEAVEVTFDRSRVSYAELLRVFWSEHDAALATDGKSQYRSVIWPHDEAQQEVATEQLRSEVAAASDAGRAAPATVVAPIAPMEGAARRTAVFTVAEQYHQNFWVKARFKFGALALALLLPLTDDPTLIEVANVARPLVVAILLLEYFELMVAAFPDFD